MAKSKAQIQKQPIWHKRVDSVMGTSNGLEVVGLADEPAASNSGSEASLPQVGQCEAKQSEDKQRNARLNASSADAITATKSHQHTPPNQSADPNEHKEAGWYCDLYKMFFGYVGDKSPFGELLQARCMQIANKQIALYGTAEFPRIPSKEKTQCARIRSNLEFCVGVNANVADTSKALPHPVTPEIEDKAATYHLLRDAQAAARSKYNKYQAKRVKRTLYKEFRAFEMVIQYPTNSPRGFVLAYEEQFAANDASVSVLRKCLQNHQGVSNWKDCSWKNNIFFATPLHNPGDRDKGEHSMKFMPICPPFLKDKKRDSTWGECFVSALQPLYPGFIMTGLQQPKLYEAAFKAIQFDALDSDALEIFFSLPERNSRLTGWLFEFRLRNFEKDGTSWKRWRYLRALELEQVATPVVKFCRLAKASKIGLTFNVMEAPDRLETEEQVMHELCNVGYRKMNGWDDNITESVKKRVQDSHEKMVGGNEGGKLQVIREDMPLLRLA